MRRQHRISFAFMLLSAGTGMCAQDVCIDGRREFNQRSFAAAQDLLWNCWTQNRLPDTTEVVYQLAQTYRELKNYETGLARLKSDNTNAKIVDRLYLEGYLLFRMQDHHGSIKALHRAFKLSPADWRIHHLFALNFVVLDRREAAIHEFQTAIQLEPRNAEIRYHLSRYYYTLNRFELAIDEAKQALALAPNFIEARSNLGLCYQAVGQSEAATQEHELSVKLAEASSSSDEWPYLNYGEWLAFRGEVPKALSVAEKAIKIAPESAHAWAFSGKVKASMQQYPEAKKALLTAVKLNPDLAAPYYQLATVCRKMGDAESSKLFLQQFVKRKAQSDPKPQAP
jgi:tetratricopeptide (TPR) repeat protein